MGHLLNLVFKDKQSFVDIKEWKVLTMDNLSFGFVIWLYSCMLTILVFFVELAFWVAITKAKIRFIGYIRHKWNQLPVIYPFKVKISDKQC
jgi:hypothetical protein